MKAFFPRYISNIQYNKDSFYKTSHENKKNAILGYIQEKWAFITCLQFIVHEKL